MAAAITPEEEWRRKSSFYLDGFRTTQGALWERLGVGGPCPRSEIRATVARLVQENGERFADGDLVHLRVPDAGATGSAVVEFRRGRTIRTLAEQDSGEPGAWIESEEHPLADLADEAHSLVAATGCREVEAVAFLLADEPFVLPWVQVRPKSGPFGPRFTIEIGTADVPAERLAEEYTRHANIAVGAERRRRRVSVESYRLVRFVDEHRSRHIRDQETWDAWERERATWSGEPKGIRQFSTVKSFRNHYKATKKRIEAHKGGGED
jgi:hypothetical protein